MDDAKEMSLMRMWVVNMLTAVDVDERVEIANSESNENARSVNQTQVS